MPILLLYSASTRGLALAAYVEILIDMQAILVYMQAQLEYLVVNLKTETSTLILVKVSH